MLRAYVSAGFDPEQFWGLTLRIYLLHMRGAADRLDREHRGRAWQAWHTAYLPDAKQRPTLAQMITGEPIKQPDRDWEAELAAWERFANMGRPN